MSFRSTFLAVFLGTALLLGALLLHRARPAGDRDHPTADLVRATGKCAECHRHETSAIVVQYEHSAHNQAGVSCLECHAVQPGQERLDHNGFAIAAALTAQNCKRCHATEYEQFARSRHALPAFAAVDGTAGMTAEMIAEGERLHPGAVDRPANALIAAEGSGTRAKGCMVCHSIGKPNADGSIGSCTHCHSRHSTSIALAREPTTCGQCHMGPDHSQLEIYSESKHGVLFAAQRDSLRLDADPKTLTTEDMSVPTCATCHMSGLEGLNVTHDTTERLAWFLFAPISTARPGAALSEARMKEACLKCHAKQSVERFYSEAEVVLHDTNRLVQAAKETMDALYAGGHLSAEPFDEPIEFLYFDLWHYFGRTAKHGAYMGGADFVQWHGSYELLAKKVELDELAAEIRGAD
jgi:hypothetical protein